MRSIPISVIRWLIEAMSRHNALRIFVVDDEFVIAWSIGKILSSKGFEARTFTNPREALAAAPREFPQLLISDVRMPEMSGIDLALQVQAVCPDCKVLLISGYTSTDELLAGARESRYLFDVLRKPVHPEILLAAVSEYIR